MRIPRGARLQVQLASRLKSLKKSPAKLMWVGGCGVLIIAVLVTWGTFSRTSASAPVKPIAAPDLPPVAATVAEAKPVPAAPTDRVNGAASVYGAASWIPVYPGSAPEITSSAQTPENDQNVSTFKTGDTPAKVISYFQDQLKSSGFNIKSASSGEESGSLQAEDGLKKRTLVLGVNALPDGAGADARLVTNEKK
jgi:hypothetical protein